MKSHGLLFTADMILAILDGRKTETRRVVTMHNSLIDGTGTGIRAHWPYLDWSSAYVDQGPSPVGNPGPYWHARCLRPDCDGAVHRVYPRIQPGDELWARETWAPHPVSDSQSPPERILFKADGANYDLYGRGPEILDYPHWMPGPWKSPLHMRRDMARIVRECTRVGAERVQDISPEEALAEGSYLGKCPCMPHPRPGVAIDMLFKQTWCHAHGQEFKKLWESINGSKPGRNWASNPPVWVFSWDLK